MNPVALVLGGAKCVWDDLERARALTAGLDVVVVAANHAGWLFRGDLDGWVTLHPERFAGWRADRAGAGLNEDYRAFAHRARGDMAGVEVRGLGWSGSSGLFAAQVAVQALGAAGVILCGVPMVREGGHILDGDDWPLAEKYRPGWIAAQAAGLPVRSMGGWTADLFGVPDATWLADLNPGPARARQKAPEAMMRVKMLKTRNFIHPEDKRLTTKYLADGEYTVKREHGAALVAEGDAREIRAPRRDPLDHDGDGRKGGSAAAAPIAPTAAAGD